MIYFNCDYLEGGHPKILERMMETNMEQLTGYSTDHYCDSAREKIRRACGREDADVHFLVGGTQTNLIAIASILKPYQGVLAAHDGHIACHETGAIEATGHKVLPVPCVDGKITGDEVRQYCSAHATDTMREHTVQPGMVYISFPTEIGSLYTKAELTALSEVCRACGLYLFLDGARMAYGLMSAANDLTLADIAALCDAFYLGGTKCGALFGEALVLTHPALDRDFRYAIKQHGGMLAKGRLLGLQFLALLGDGSPDAHYFAMAARADAQARRIADAFAARGCRMRYDSPTNQQFPILPAAWARALAERYAYSHMGACEGGELVRFCTSWATRDEDVDALVADIAAL